MTPIQTIIEVTNGGGTFRLHGESMKVLVPDSATLELTASLRANKPALIEYLHGDNRNWCLTRSELLGGVLIFLARDEVSKGTLVGMGASARMVYTRNELKGILESGASPEWISIAHDARTTLDGRFVGSPANWHARNCLVRPRCHSAQMRVGWDSGGSARGSELTATQKDIERIVSLSRDLGCQSRDPVRADPRWFAPTSLPKLQRHGRTSKDRRNARTGQPVETTGVLQILNSGASDCSGNLSGHDRM